jgi:hypothetical protein
MEDNNNMTLPLEEADNNITESPVSSVEYTDDNIHHHYSLWQMLPPCHQLIKL